MGNVFGSGRFHPPMTPTIYWGGGYVCAQFLFMTRLRVERV
ncbi:hypothetical protein [Humisphaera borealis]